MKKIYLFLILAFLSSCKAQLNNQNLDWKEFVSEEGNFKVSFPGSPEQTIRTSPLGNGTIQHPKFEVSLPQMNFSVYFGDIPDLRNLDQEETKSFYNYLQNETLRLNNSQLVSNREVTIDKKIGYEFVESRNDKIVSYRLLLNKNRHYQLKTEFDSSLKTDVGVKEKTERFFDSFQILKQ